MHSGEGTWRSYFDGKGQNLLRRLAELEDRCMSCLQLDGNIVYKCEYRDILLSKPDY